MFYIDDEAHAELQPGEFPTLDGAVEELKRRAAIPWNEAPNIAPCSGWRTCGRVYQIVEYDATTQPWTEIQRLAALDISSHGVVWHI